MSIQSMYIPMGDGDFGGGTKVLAEQTLPNVRYALLKQVTHGYKVSPRPGMRTRITHSVVRFELDNDGLWLETSYTEYPTLAKAKAAFKALVNKT